MSTLCWLALNQLVQVVFKLSGALCHFLELVKIIDLRRDQRVAVDHSFFVISVDVLVAFTPRCSVEISLLLPIS